MVHQQKWYVVITGTEPGVYPTWIEAGPKTKNIPGGSIHQSFSTEAEAIRAFEAAKARGEVKAYPIAEKKGNSTGKSKNTSLSPLMTEVSLLRTPLDLKEEADSTAFRTPLSSPARLRVAKLRRTLKDSRPTYSCSTVFSSPPTNITRVNSPLVYDGPPESPGVQPSPHFTFPSSSSRAYPDVSNGSVEEMLLQLDVSDEDSESPPPTPLIPDSLPGAEEHTPKPSRCMPLHPDPPSRSKGVKYRGLTELADMANTDPRIWLPKARIFDPDKVKPRPLTRPPSPVKRIVSPSVSGHETVASSPQFSLLNSPFVRAGRGRTIGLTPSVSLPILPDRELEDKCLSCGSLLEGRRMSDKGKDKDPDYSVRHEHRAAREQSTSPASPRNDSRSHVQLVFHDGKDERSAIVVHCPPNCPHGACFRSLLVQPSRPTGSEPLHVDACVSPVVTISGSVQSSPKTRSQGSDFDGNALYELTGSTHVSHQGLAPEADVRSPIARGTMVPMNALEIPFGRPSPAVRISDLKIDTRWNA